MSKKRKRQKLPVFPVDLTNPAVQQEIVQIAMHYVNLAERFVSLVGFSFDMDEKTDVLTIRASVRPKKFSMGGGGSRKYKPPTRIPKSWRRSAKCPTRPGVNVN